MAPAQAAAAGFKCIVFNEEFMTNDVSTSTSAKSGSTWYPWNWAGTSTVSFANGYLTLTGAGSGSDDSGNIATVPSYPTVGASIPNAWLHGYFEAKMQFSATQLTKSGSAVWPGIWSWGTNYFYEQATYPKNPATSVSEMDIFEAYPTGTGFTETNTLHNWSFPPNGGASADTKNTEGTNDMKSLQGSSESASPTDGNWHTYGALWTLTSAPSTAGTAAATGTIQFYYDDALVVHENGITSYKVGSGTGFTAQEIQPMVMILQASPTQPINVQWVRVWQDLEGATTGTFAGATVEANYTPPTK